MECAMEKASKYGKTSRFTKAIGSTTRLKVGVGLYTAMEMFMRATGKTIKPTAKESTCTKMGQATLDNGTKISSMVLEYKSGSMARLTKGIHFLNQKPSQWH
jgi:hypothetical protein